MARVLIGNVKPVKGVDYQTQEDIEELKQLFAPAGYGLGDQGAVIKTNNAADVDDFKRNGWIIYHSTDKVKLIDTATNSHGCSIYTEMFANIYGRQTAWTLDGGFLQRDYNAGVWQPWDWYNPALYPWTEYRTVERYGGKPVYIRTMNWPGIPGPNSVKEVDHGIQDINRILDFGGEMLQSNANAVALPYRYSSDNYAYLSVDLHKVRLESGATDLTAYTDFNVWIKYTKTTDY